MEVIRWHFAQALQGKLTPELKAGRIEKIILYGSMARGTWRYDPENGFKSDYDLLVIVNHERLTDFDYWGAAEDEIGLLEAKNPRRHPTEFIVHSLADVNDQISRGRPFFADIRREGVVVYEASTKELARQGNLTAEEQHAEAREHFETWYPKIGESLEIAQFCVARKNCNDAAFNLHQACERAYHCALLTLTLYSPKLHNLKKLREMAGGKDERLFAAWPRKLRRDKQVFELIRRAYVEARYSKHYEITKEQLDVALANAERLQAIVKEVCEERLHQI
mgnify:CR=1 FL=1